MVYPRINVRYLCVLYCLKLKRVTHRILRIPEFKFRLISIFNRQTTDTVMTIDEGPREILKSFERPTERKREKEVSKSEYYENDS